MMNINRKIHSPKQLVRLYASLLPHILPDKFVNPPTDIELDVLAYLTLLQPQYSLARFSAQARKVVATQMGNISKANLNSKLYSLIDKGYLYRDDDQVLYLNRTFLKGAMMLLYKLYPENKYLTDYEAQKLGIDFITLNQQEQADNIDGKNKLSYSLAFTFERQE